MINEEIKKKYPSIRFDKLEAFMSAYDKRYCSSAIPKSIGRDTLIGHIGVEFLLCCLQRSRCVFTGFLDCVNRTHVVLAFLATRAHFETTGSVAYFLRHLRQFYKKEIKCEEIENVLFRLSLGCKSFPDKSDIPGRADAINVLTQIDGADKLFEEIAGKTNKPFRKHYDVLSEFCHPNLLGLTVAADILDGETIVYYKQPEFTENDFGVLINDMLMSCTIFFCIFDESLSLLENNERIPTLIKPDK